MTVTTPLVMERNPALSLVEMGLVKFPSRETASQECSQETIDERATKVTSVLEKILSRAEPFRHGGINE
jgi:hypothetical protein